MLDVRETSLQGWTSVGDQGRQTERVQCGTVVPYWIGEIAAHGVDEDLVVVEFEDDVGKPPVALSLVAFAIAGGSSWCRR